MPGPSRVASKQVPLDENSRSALRNPESTAGSTLHIFSCLFGVTNDRSESIDEEVLGDHLREVDEYLRSRTSFKDRRVYNACPKATHKEILSSIEIEGLELSRLTGSQHIQQQNYEARLDVFNAIDMVFKLFLPIQVEVPTVQKFWGAVRVIIMVS